MDYVNNSLNKRSSFRHAPSLAVANANEKIRKTAAELLEATKPLYVKSESVLENRQEWNVKSPNSVLFHKTSPVFNCRTNFYEQFHQREQQQDFIDADDSSFKKTPPPVPPKNRRISSTNSSPNIFDFRTVSIDNSALVASPHDLSKPPVPPKPKFVKRSTTMTEECSPCSYTLIRKDNADTGVVDSYQSPQDDLKNCLISLLIPDVNNSKISVNNRNRAESYPMTATGNSLQTSCSGSNGRCSTQQRQSSHVSSPNLHTATTGRQCYYACPYYKNVPNNQDESLTLNPALNFIEISNNANANTKRRKSMPDLSGSNDGYRSNCLTKKYVGLEEDYENSTVGADDGSSSARYDISFVSTTNLDDVSSTVEDKSLCESLTSSPRRKPIIASFVNKRYVSLPSTESDHYLHKQASSCSSPVTAAALSTTELCFSASVVPVEETESTASTASFSKSSSALHKFFNSMGLEQAVWRNLNGKANGSDIDSVKYFSNAGSIPSSVGFSKSSDSASECPATNHATSASGGERCKSNDSTTPGGGGRVGNSRLEHSSQKPVSIIERNARVIKWIYACGKDN